MKPLLLDLFSGIGGFSFALRTMARTVAYCEADEQCRTLLTSLMHRKLIHSAPVYDDIITLTGASLKHKPHIITAGFPCQDIAAGNPNGKGIKGPRSQLVFHVFRLIDELPSVQCVIFENSPMIEHRGMKTLLRALHKRGFSTRWGIFTPAALGAPLIRKRWFCVAQRVGDVPIKPPQARIIHDWTREKVPRVVSRSSAVAQQAVRRCCMLGNSVVPQCVVHATKTLLQQFPKPNASAIKDTVPLHSIRVHMRQGSASYTRKYWASPNATPRLWYQYKILTARSADLLSNQIFFDVTTQRQHGGVRSNERLCTLYKVSPVWVEWLMGYPINYTRV